jgi:uncharacterized LabA/DUF88 family protein
MPFYEDETIAVFIDGMNTHNVARALGFEIDYSRLMKYFKESSHLLRMYYYTTVNEEVEHQNIRPLLDWLSYNEYTVVTKPMKQFTDSAGIKRNKNSMDIELTIDALSIASKVDHIVLMTGDSDFVPLVNELKRLGNRVTVISTIKTSPQMIAEELRRNADSFLDLNEMMKYIKREHEREYESF